MSTEAATSAVVPARHHHGLRLTLAAVTALVAGWYSDNALVVLLAPILTVLVMGPGSAAPGPKAALVGPLAIWLGAGRPRPPGPPVRRPSARGPGSAAGHAR